MRFKENSFGDTAYGSSEFLCEICAYPMTESCYPCGRENYWQSFEPRHELLENPPEFPNMKKWHSAGYGEKLNILAFYMRALMKQERPYL